MFEVIIGVGTYSVPGGDIERGLLNNGHPLSTFDIVPIQEAKYETTTLLALHRRSLHFAERMHQSKSARYFVGVASGFVKSMGIGNGATRLKGTARVDVASALSQNGKTLEVLCLNPGDIRWQLSKKLIGLSCGLEATATFLIFYEKLCKKVGTPTNKY